MIDHKNSLIHRRSRIAYKRFHLRDFEKVDMGVCKWACLILCWIRGSPVALQSSCETVSDLKLCPIRVGEGNSQITAIGKNVAEGSTAAWNREGWCGLSYNVLRVGKYRVRWKSLPEQI